MCKVKLLRWESFGCDQTYNVINTCTYLNILCVCAGNIRQVIWHKMRKICCHIITSLLERHPHHHHHHHHRQRCWLTARFNSRNINCRDGDNNINMKECACANYMFAPSHCNNINIRIICVRNSA